MHAAIPFPDISNEIFAIELFGTTFALRWYALAYLAGLVAGFAIIRALMRRSALWPEDRAPMEPGRVDDLLTAVIIGVILGGRLGFVLFYRPDYYLANPGDILKVWEGGMSFHGGFLGVVLAGLWFCWRNRVPVASLGDAMALVAPVGLFLGRIANFVNAELWGRPTDVPWGVVFPGAAAQECPGIPPGECARHPSQLYEAGLEGLALGLVLWIAVRTGALKRPGLVTGLFLVGYGLSRFVVEFVRQADSQFITADNPLGHVIHAGGIGLSMGQLLSLPMIAVGVWLWLRRRT
ncbi:Prolipoprotein diacylglyceryl transferase [Defluviimonas aquaemixtae]|uniref:Phosphatidylglycerol--prolipoprotein diacylglyceryl transferase n=1 Tax=Albidovulum aquaemixtae TaxID=1542388 RepID=A0A2R8BNM7_9RHOB|nr:prolipoprotein diacylglyceryl transferase [Defluviimonas aquaemixtae]SPH24956.1 Prolipoprotein diacylglyceryl transferase [Defluviimonas aquaemixtae]